MMKQDAFKCFIMIKTSTRGIILGKKQLPKQF